MSTPDGSTNLTEQQKAETADASTPPPDTASGGPAEPRGDDDDVTTEADGTPVENPSG